MKTPSAVRIIISQGGWNLVNSTVPGEPYNIYPSQFEGKPMSKWAIGPIEVARILERLGIRVEVTVERSL